ncbi:MAG: long-chain fatty acid--CoA ligase [Planctomycetes bacterium]|nr:long-chain fatty acid--CoA ligase [Planctomycetota bacterium]
MGINLALIPHDGARRWPDRTAIVCDETRVTLTYRELDERARRFASALARLGVKPGERVALMCPNVPDFAVAYFGILAMGAAVVPLNVLLKQDEIHYHLSDSKAVAFIAWADYLDEAEKAWLRVRETCPRLVVIHKGPNANAETAGGAGASFARLIDEAAPQDGVASPDPGQTAVILYTSGTTGKPKGAELTHDNLFWNVVATARLIDYRDGETTLAVLPLFHSFGQTCVQNTTFYVGGKVVFVTRFEPKSAAETIAKHKVSIFHGVPTMFFHLLQQPGEETAARLKSLRYAVSGGAALPAEVLRNFEKKFGVVMLEGYGLSETSPVVCFNRPDMPRKIASIGLPVWGIDMKIYGEEWRELPRGQRGEIVIRGHAIMKGYFNRPDATREVLQEGWFRTGDIGFQDEEGYFFIVDRKKEMIIRGGFNVYPREVEESLYALKGVREAAVIGWPHEQHGEEIAAFVALEAGATLTSEAIISYCKSKLAAYKYPREVHILKELPKGPTGKLLKREMKEQLLKQKGLG